MSSPVSWLLCILQVLEFIFYLDCKRQSSKIVSQCLIQLMGPEFSSWHLEQHMVIPQEFTKRKVAFSRALLTSGF